MLLSTHRLVDLLIGLLVNNPSTSVFDLHRRLQCHSRVTANMSLTLPRLSPQRADIGLGEGGRAFCTTCVHDSLSAALLRLEDVFVDDDGAGLRPCRGCRTTLITLPQMAQASFDSG